MTQTRAVLALLAGGALLWIVASQDWFAAAQTGELAGVSAGGDTAPENSPVLVACAGIVALCGLLLLLLRRIGRWIVSGFAAAAALGYAGMALSALNGTAETTGAPLVGLIAGLLVAALAVWVLLSAGRWQASRKFDADAAQGTADPGADAADEVDPITGWDALSRGEDPS